MVSTTFVKTDRTVCILLVQGFGWELELAHRDGVHGVERDPDDLLTQQVDEVVLAHQQRPAQEAQL